MDPSTPLISVCLNLHIRTYDTTVYKIDIKAVNT